MAVHRAVAERDDHSRLAEHRFARSLLEARLVNQRREVVLVRELQRSIVLVRPRYRQLECAARMEARRAWVGVHRVLRASGSLEDGRPFALEESELAHTEESSSHRSMSATASTPSAIGKRSTPPYTTLRRSGPTVLHARWKPRSIFGASPRLISIAQGA